jgi:hypothetical protein
MFLKRGGRMRFSLLDWLSQFAELLRTVGNSLSSNRVPGVSGNCGGGAGGG